LARADLHKTTLRELFGFGRHLRDDVDHFEDIGPEDMKAHLPDSMIRVLESEESGRERPMMARDRAEQREFCERFRLAIARRDRRVRFFQVHHMRLPRRIDHRVSPIRVTVPTLRACLAGRLMALEMEARPGIEALRRRIAAERERAEARDLEASELAIVSERIKALVDLVAALVGSALVGLDPRPLPHILAAGGQTLAFVPRT
jgi:hypothetical protein